MKKKKISIIMGIALFGAIAVLGAQSAFAAEVIGTVTGKDGDVKDKILISGEITDVDGSHVTIKDVDTDEEYETSFGPSWYSEDYQIGEEVEVVGVVTDPENNDNDHNLQTLEVDETVLRDDFEEKPNWAGGRHGSGEAGEGEGQAYRHGNQGAGTQQGAGFVDADGDGNCDNL